MEFSTWHNIHLPVLHLRPTLWSLHPCRCGTWTAPPCPSTNRISPHFLTCRCSVQQRFGPSLGRFALVNTNGKTMVACQGQTNDTQLLLLILQTRQKNWQKNLLTVTRWDGFNLHTHFFVVVKINKKPATEIILLWGGVARFLCGVVLWLKVFCKENNLYKLKPRTHTLFTKK